MGGKLNFQSLKGGGTKVYFLLPLVESTLPTQPLPPSAPIPAENPPPEQAEPTVLPSGPYPTQVLVVEDHPINARLVRTLLDREACQTTLATRLSEAGDLLARQDFDLVFLDLELPDGSAFDLLATRPVADKTWPPIVALTANALPETRQRCLDAGMDDYLSKPFTQEAFLAVLNK
jgi:hypothetical protein